LNALLRVPIDFADVQKSLARRREIRCRETAIMAWIADLSRLGGASDDL
jgi:hypothetical protein